MARREDSKPCRQRARKAKPTTPALMMLKAAAATEEAAEKKIRLVRAPAFLGKKETFSLKLPSSCQTIHHQSSSGQKIFPKLQQLKHQR